MDISEALSPNPVSAGGTVYVSGHVNLTNGTNVSGNSIGVYTNGSLVNGTGSSDSSGDYNISFVEIFLRQIQMGIIILVLLRL